MRTLIVIVLLCTSLSSFAWERGAEKDTWFDYIGPRDSDDATRLTLKIIKNKRVEAVAESICSENNSGTLETYTWIVGERTGKHTFCNGKTVEEAVPPVTESPEIEQFPLEVRRVLHESAPLPDKPFGPSFIAGS